MSGYEYKAYSYPHIILTEVSPEGIEVQTSIECILRGATLIAKANAVKKKNLPPIRSKEVIIRLAAIILSIRVRKGDILFTI